MVLGGLAGVIGRRGSTPSFHFEGLQTRPGSKSIFRGGFMYNVPYIPDALGLSAEVAENKFSLFINIKINIV